MMRSLRGLACGLSIAFLFELTPIGKALCQGSEVGEKVNILLITADDLNHDSLGVTGCAVPDITPNLDRLAEEGLRFKHAHVTIAVCQPCRAVLMTGLYPHHNGARGFEPIREEVTTLTEQLRSAGYLNGILGKVEHLQPEAKFAWDYVKRQPELGAGRDPSRYYQYSKEFFDRAKGEGKPFFLMANTHDPHRPFPGSDQEKDRIEKSEGGFVPPKSNWTVSPAKVAVPGFLPDLPDIRLEVAEYYAAVHRADETVGEVLRALEEAGLAENTLVMFLSDNGMAFPFAKTNCYLQSTQTPWIVRWPGKVESGAVDETHFIAGVDFTPTVLEAAGLESAVRLNGRSFLPLLIGEEQERRDFVFTVFHETSAQREYPMRALHDEKFGYIFNAWSDGETVFLNESQNGLTFAAMQEAAKKDEAIAARLKMFLNRTQEELYDYKEDPDSLKNLISDPEYADALRLIRKKMLETLVMTQDPLADTYSERVFGKFEFTENPVTTAP
jgi:N-sulfoglucosamine sulfohydrolase